MSQNDIIAKLRKDESYFKELYEGHRTYSLNFMRSMNGDDELIVDIYQNAMIVLLEKVRDPKFALNCSVQTYLNSICRNQLLTKHRENSRFISKSEDFDENIRDWHEGEYDDEKDSFREKINYGLLKLKESGGKCHEILIRFWYKKQNFHQIASAMGYTNARNAQHQKARCQKRLKKLSV